MTIGKKLNQIASNVNHKKAMEIAMQMFEIIIKDLEDVASSGQFYLILKNQKYDPLYQTGLQNIIEKYLDELLKKEDIKLLFESGYRDENYYKVKF